MFRYYVNIFIKYEDESMKKIKSIFNFLLESFKNELSYADIDVK